MVPSIPPTLRAGTLDLVFDAGTGVPLAQLDGNQITSRRTAAASALAAWARSTNSRTAPYWVRLSAGSARPLYWLAIVYP